MKRKHIIMNIVSFVGLVPESLKIMIEFVLFLNIFSELKRVILFIMINADKMITFNFKLWR